MSGELKHKSVGTELSQAEFEAVDLHVFDSQARGDIPYASSATQLSRLAVGAVGAVLISDGTDPTWDTTPTLKGDFTFEDNIKVTLGTGGDADLYYDGADVVLDVAVVGSGDFYVKGGRIEVDDSEGIAFGTGKDATISYNGTDLIISPAVVGTGEVKISGGSLFLDSGEKIDFASGDVTLTHAADMLTLAGGGLTLPTLVASTSVSTPSVITASGDLTLNPAQDIRLQRPVHRRGSGVMNHWAWHRNDLAVLGAGNQLRIRIEISTAAPFQIRVKFIGLGPIGAIQAPSIDKLFSAYVSSSATLTETATDTRLINEFVDTEVYIQKGGASNRIDVVVQYPAAIRNDPGDDLFWYGLDLELLSSVGHEGALPFVVEAVQEAITP